MRRAIKSVLTFVVFAFAIGYFWGAGEALSNYYRPVHYIPRAFYLLDSVNDRAIFYVILTSLLFALGLSLSAFLRRLFNTKPHNGRLTAFPIILCATLSISNNLFYFGQSSYTLVAFGKSVNDLFGGLKIWDPASFLILFYVVGVFATFGYLQLRGSRKAAKILYAAAGVTAFLFFVFQVVSAYKAASRPVPSHLPDIYVITIDACRADYFTDETAPKITAYARENSVVFDNARAPTSWTTPSFASMFTGQYPDVCTGNGFYLRREQTTLADALYDNGYDTYLITGNPVFTLRRGLPRGFRHFFYWEMSLLLDKTGYYETNLYHLFSHRYNIKTGRGVINDVLSKRVFDIIDEDNARPKFVWVHYLDPHTPYSPKPEYVSREYRDVANDRAFYLSDDVFIPENVPVLKELYKGEIRMLDDEISSLIKRIEASGDPIIIFTSDHGEEFNDHGGFKHGNSAYEEVLRVPFFIKFPAATADYAGGVLVERNVNTAAIAPTLLDFLGFDVPPSMQFGSLFIKSINGQEITFFGSRTFTGERVYAAVEGDLKLIVHDTELEAGGEYYDLSTDPGESKPLPFDETAERLRRALIERVEANARLAQTYESGRTAEIPADDLRALGYLK